MNRSFVSLSRFRSHALRFSALIYIPFIAGFLIQMTPQEISEAQIQGCLLIIDWNDLLCSSCMESFLHFCRYIQTALSEERIVGILIYDRKLNDQHERFPFIIQKKQRKKQMFNPLFSKSEVISFLLRGRGWR